MRRHVHADLLTFFDAEQVEVFRFVGDGVELDVLSEDELLLALVLKGNGVGQKLAGLQRHLDLLPVHRNGHRSAVAAIKDAGDFPLAPHFTGAPFAGAFAHIDIECNFDLGHCFCSVSP